MIDDILLWPTSSMSSQSTSRIIMHKARQPGKTRMVIDWYAHWQERENIMKVREVKGEWHITVEEPKAKVEWCREAFGEGGRRKDLRWNASWADLYQDDVYTWRKTATIMFRDKEAVAMFRLMFASE
jgi:hypothetical protein